ncbi:MAG: hypothetical protein IKH30_16520 [Clostridia bacterium]|nr:hypothetical protein [Clostridia bacterium]
MKGYNKVCFAIVILLFVVGVVFLGISMFASNPGKHDLAIALLCITAGNVINMIQIWKRRKEEKDNGK